MSRGDDFGGSRLIGGGIRFECQKCRRCCSGPGGHVCITEDEGGAIAGILGVDPGDFFPRFTGRADGRIVLREAGNGDCWFLGRDGCHVYPVRPYQCRSWPFWFRNLRSDESWARVARECPGIGKGPLHTAEEIIRWLNGSPLFKERK